MSSGTLPRVVDSASMALRYVHLEAPCRIVCVVCL